MKSLVSFLIVCIAATTVFASDAPKPAQDFAFVTTKGKHLQLSDLRGRVVVLDFWASWCVPCRKEFPFLIRLYEDFNLNSKTHSLEVIAINLDEHSDKMDKFLAGLYRTVPFMVTQDPKGKLPRLYKVDAMPTTVFIDRSGRVRYRHRGFKQSYKKIYEQELTELLNEQPASDRPSAQ